MSQINLFEIIFKMIVTFINIMVLKAFGIMVRVFANGLAD